MKDLRFLIIHLLVLLFLLWILPAEAGDLEVWWKQPGDKYWQQCIAYRDSGGLGPVERRIPDGAIIAIRDHETWSLTVLTK